MFKEGYQSGRDPDHLVGCHVHVLDIGGIHEFKVCFMPGNDIPRHELRTFNLPLLVCGRIRRSDKRFGFFIRTKPDNIVENLALFHFHVRSDKETIVVDARVNGEARDQTDVRTFRRFDRANSSVVGDVNISNFETRTFPVQTAWPERGKSSFVSELGKWIGLIHDLRQFATPEEVLDCCGNTFGIHERARRHVLDIFQAHAFLHGSTQF